jgi:hypothetical protein
MLPSLAERSGTSAAWSNEGKQHMLVGAKVRVRPDAPSRLTLCLVGASSQLAGGADEFLVARRSLARGSVQRVLEADAGVEAPPYPSIRKSTPKRSS